MPISFSPPDLKRALALAASMSQSLFTVCLIRWLAGLDPLVFFMADSVVRGT